MALFNSEKRQKKAEEYKKTIYKEWGQVSERGKYYYGLKQATVGWAWPILVIYVFMMFMLSKLNEAFVFDWTTISTAGIIFMAFGFFQGITEFNRNEKIYRQKYPYKNKHKRKKKTK